MCSPFFTWLAAGRVRLMWGAEAGDDFPDLVEFGRLVEEVRGTVLHADPAILRIRMVGQHDEDDLRRERADFAQYFNTGAARQVQVQHHRVGSRAQDAIDGGG